MSNHVRHFTNLFWYRSCLRKFFRAWKLNCHRKIHYFGVFWEALKMVMKSKKSRHGVYATIKIDWDPFWPLFCPLHIHKIIRVLMDIHYMQLSRVKNPLKEFKVADEKCLHSFFGVLVHVQGPSKRKCSKTLSWMWEKCSQFTGSLISMDLIQTEIWTT